MTEAELRKILDTLDRRDEKSESAELREMLKRQKNPAGRDTWQDDMDLLRLLQRHKRAGEKRARRRQEAYRRLDAQRGQPEPFAIRPPEPQREPQATGAGAHFSADELGRIREIWLRAGLDAAREEHTAAHLRFSFASGAVATIRRDRITSDGQDHAAIRASLKTAMMLWGGAHIIGGTRESQLLAAAYAQVLDIPASTSERFSQAEIAKAATALFAPDTPFRRSFSSARYRPGNGERALFTTSAAP